MSNAGAENGYTYTGAEHAYRVTMLKRDVKRGTARVRIEECLTGNGTIPVGADVTVPIRRVEVN
jgi:hypothetical protein